MRLLFRVRQARCGDRWLVRARDERGRRTTLVIGVCEEGVTLTPGQPGRLVLAPLQAGHLRAGIRDAVEVLDQPALAVQGLAPDPSREHRRRAPEERVQVTLSPQSEQVGPERGGVDSAHFTEEEFHVNAGFDRYRPLWPTDDLDAEPLAA
ncbi:MAG: hypothetical protein ACRDQF_05005 [Thermocrispum sp.]